MSSLIWYFVLAEFTNFLFQWKPGERKLSGSPKSHEHRDLDCIDGESVVFDWKDFPRHTTMQLLRDIQTTMEKNRSQPEQSEDRVIFMSMYNDIDSGKAGNKETCISNSSEAAACARRFPKGHRSFLGTRNRKNVVWNAHTHKPNGL